MKSSMRIADELRRRIARGDFAAGDSLPTEDALTTELGYSKPVVREALRILETEGLLEVKRGVRGGPRVRHPSISDAAKPMGVYLQIGDVTVMDVWGSRDRIVAAAVERLAAADGVDLAPLEARVTTLADHKGEIGSYYQHMLDTSETAVELAGSVTDHLVVMALRHVIEVELAAATAAAGDVEEAVQAQETIADAWIRTLRHIRAGHSRAARAAFEAQALFVQEQLAELTGRVTVGDLVAKSPAERVRDHSIRMRRAKRNGSQA